MSRLGPKTTASELAFIPANKHKAIPSDNLVLPLRQERKRCKRLTVLLLASGDLVEVLADTLEEHEPLARQIPDEIFDPIQSLVVLGDRTSLNESAVAWVGNHRLGKRADPQLERATEDVDVDVVQPERRVPVERMLQRGDGGARSG